MEARCHEMFTDPGFQETLAELPRSRFEDVDTTRARELFGGLGLTGESDTFFKVAWAALGRRFHDKITETTHAAKLVEHGRWGRIESYLARVTERVDPRHDDTAVVAAYRRFVHGFYRLADTRGLFWREKETTGEEIELVDVFVETLVQRRDLLPAVKGGTKDARRPHATEDDPRRSRHGEIREEARDVASVSRQRTPPGDSRPTGLGEEHPDALSRARSRGGQRRRTPPGDGTAQVDGADSPAAKDLRRAPQEGPRPQAGRLPQRRGRPPGDPERRPSAKKASKISRESWPRTKGVSISGMSQGSGRLQSTLRRAHTCQRPWWMPPWM
jgi:hypothetical protein